MYLQKSWLCSLEPVIEKIFFNEKNKIKIKLYLKSLPSTSIKTVKDYCKLDTIKHNRKNLNENIYVHWQTKIPEKKRKKENDH